MILEVADIRIKPGLQAEFEVAVEIGVRTVIAQAHGFKSYQIRHSIETPERYILMLEWETLEDHTVGFRQSPAFSEWRAMVASFFSEAPFTEHFLEIASADNTKDIP
jgi:heme-degrading monooxygenase HmoA